MNSSVVSEASVSRQTSATRVPAEPSSGRATRSLRLAARKSDWGSTTTPTFASTRSSAAGTSAGTGPASTTCTVARSASVTVSASARGESFGIATTAVSVQSGMLLRCAPTGIRAKAMSASPVRASSTSSGPIGSRPRVVSGKRSRQTRTHFAGETPGTKAMVRAAVMQPSVGAVPWYPWRRNRR